MNDNKKRHELTEKDRNLIEENLKNGRSLLEIADFLCVHVRTNRREIARGTVEFKDSQLRIYKAYSAYYAN